MGGILLLPFQICQGQLHNHKWINLNFDTRIFFETRDSSKNMLSLKNERKMYLKLFAFTHIDIIIKTFTVFAPIHFDLSANFSFRLEIIFV